MLATHTAVQVGAALRPEMCPDAL